jgi:hypothetical protein
MHIIQNYTLYIALFSNDSGLKTAMPCPLLPIYRYMYVLN